MYKYAIVHKYMALRLVITLTPLSLHPHFPPHFTFTPPYKKTQIDLLNSYFEALKFAHTKEMLYLCTAFKTKEKELRKRTKKTT
jgi:hypothetical protein